VIVIGVWMGWLVHCARIQHEAVAAIEQSGGLVSYDSGPVDDPVLNHREPSAPRWLVNAIGIDYFAHASLVVFDRPCSDKDLSHVGRLSELRVLFLDASEVTDGGLAHLDRLVKLRQLLIGSAHVTDAGLVHLKRLSNLSVLTLIDTQVTDAGLAHLKELPNLSHLDLVRSQATFGGVRELRRALPRLTIEP
jgi:hypothetical protein